jgi:hypothetical protein
MEQLNTNLSIKATGIANRINNEIAHLFNQFDFVSTERKESSILIKVIKGKNTYEINLQNDYPFRPPSNIIYNGFNYKKSLSYYPVKIQQILKNKYNIICLCCDTILCESKWMPSMNMSHIINEIHKFSNIKKEIKIILLCDEIRTKYRCLSEFADFEKYLF